MKTIGLIGGVSWHSTVEYYSHLNRMVSERLNGHSAKCLIASLDFGEVVANNAADDQEANFRLIDAAAQTLRDAGAQCLLICANTMNMFTDRVSAATGLPVIHIATAAGEAAKRLGFSTVGLLGTKYVMEMDFYRTRLEACGLTVLTPNQEERDYIHRNIYDELTNGRFTDEAKQKYLAIIVGLVGRGAEGIVLGCTEIPILLRDVESTVPLLDTTMLHAQAAVDFMLGEQEGTSKQRKRF